MISEPMNKLVPKFAKAYAAYLSGWLGKSIYDAWFMFFAQIILDAKSDVLDIVSIRDEFNTRYNIKIPIDFVRQTLFLHKDVLGFDKNKVSIIDHARLVQSIAPDQKYVESWNKLKTAFERFCISEGMMVGPDLESVILDCVESYDVEVVAPHEDFDIKKKCELSYKWNVFIRRLEGQAPDIFDFVCSLSYGSIAKEAMFCTEGVNIVFRGLKVYLDAPIVFHLLGIADVEEKERAEQLVSGLSTAGCTLWIFKHTLEEVNSIAVSSRRWALDVNDYDPAKASKTARFFRSHQYSEQEINEFICDIEGDIRERFGVNVDNMTYEAKSHGYQVDVTRLHSMFDERYKYADEEEREDKERGIENDIHSISLLYRLRGGARPKNFHQCRTLMVTSSSTMANVCRSFAYASTNSHDLPVCVSSKILASFLWLGNPKKLMGYKRLELLADCARYLRPTNRILAKFFEKVKKVDVKDEQTQKKYFMLTTAPALDQVLMETINGKEENITDNTVEAVCERVRADMISKYSERESRDRLADRIARRQRRNAKLKSLINPIAAVLWILSFVSINGGVAAILFFLEQNLDRSSFVGYIALAVLDAICLGGLIHEKWGVHVVQRIAIRMVRSIFSYFQY